MIPEHVIPEAAPAIAGAPSRRGPNLIPGLPVLAPNVERHPIPGGGTRTLILDSGDEPTVIDREGRQPCELVVFDREGRSDPALLGADRPREEAARARAIEILDFSGLGERREDPGLSLPHGLQRALGVAVAFAEEPKPSCWTSPSPA